jgi:outer membrane lipoprotein-sorting protein
MPAVIAALLAASIPVLAAPAKDPAAAVARRVERHYQRIKDFSARFAQTSTYPTFGNVKNATGKVFLKKPVLLRWQYDDGRLIVIDGKELWRRR